MAVRTESAPLELRDELPECRYAYLNFTETAAAQGPAPA